MKRKRKKQGFLLLVVAACLAYAACVKLGLPPSATISGSNRLQVHFVDVGQADCTLVQLPNGENMLIDAGNNENGSQVVDYVKRRGIGRIDYLVGTHPHADHIGGLDDVILQLDIGEIYMPKVQTNTKTFRDVLEAVQQKGLKIKTAKAGVEILNRDNISIEILAPNADSYENLNNYSAVIRLVYRDNAFLFTGDAEELSESEITREVEADVLKAGHHGSSSSTSEEFLDRVSPQYAYIPCGKDNSYGHPHRETLEKLEERNIKIYRADEDGTVIFDSDGTKVEVSGTWK